MVLLQRIHATTCRGIVEFSNVCVNDCGYCGIRKHMGGVKRYTIPIDEVVEVAKWAFENRMGTLMLQSGEWLRPHASTLSQYTHGHCIPPA